MFEISEARQLGKPLLTYQWEILFPDPPIVLLPYTTWFSFRARAATLPGVSNEVFQTKFGPYTFQHAGKKAYSHQLTMRFEEGKNKSVAPLLYLWNMLIMNEVTGGGLPQESLLLGANLLSDMFLRLTDESNDLIFSYQIHNCFPMRVADVTLDYETANSVMLDVTWSYDWWGMVAFPFDIDFKLFP